MAYNNNIDVGSPPILWSDVDSAFRKVNENFTLLGTALARTAPVDIAHVETGTVISDPVRIVTATLHNYISEQQVTVVSTGISQLDNNTYYIKVLTPSEIELYQDIDLTVTVDGSSFDSYSSGGGTLQGISPFSSINFERLYSNVIPAETEVYDLGSASYRWKDLWLSGSSLYLGDAVITSTGTTVNLPVGSTIGGLRVDENYFKFISVPGQPSIEADDGTDTLNINASTGISITTDASTDTVIFENSGVTQLAPGLGVSLSGSIGNITVTNSGARNIIGGLGITANQPTGDITLTNDGIVGLDAGIGIGIGTRDPVTGRVTITNNQPNIIQNAVVRFFINGTDNPIIASSSTFTVNVNTFGDGLSLVSNGLDTMTFTNSGVTSFAVGDGLTINSATGAVSLSLNQLLNRDISGSIFAEDSSVMVDATSGRVVGPVETARLRTSEVSIALGNSAGATNQGANSVAIGALAGTTNQGVGTTAVGSGAGNTGQGVFATAIGYGAGQTDQGQDAVAIGESAGGTNQGDYAVAIGINAGAANQGARSVAIGYNAGNGGAYEGSIILNAEATNLTSSAAGFYVDPVRNVPGTSLLQYNSSTKEISHTNEIYSDQQISITVAGEDSTQKTWYFGNDGNLSLPPAGEINNAIGDDPDVNNYITINGFGFQNQTNLDARGIYDTLGYGQNVYLNTVGSWYINAADDIRMESGTMLGGAGNNFTILAGNGDVDDPFEPGPGRRGGNFLLAAGDGGNGTTFGDGGDVYISGGVGGSGGGGDVEIKGGLSGGVVKIGTGNVSYTNFWTFSSDGSLKIPGDIKSEGNINIDINLADSTLRRWEFGEDGNFNVPGDVTLPGTLYVSTIDTSDSSAITVVPAVTFNSDVTVENELFVGVSRVMPIAELKSIVAASIDFADFQARIAAL